MSTQDDNRGKLTPPKPTNPGATANTASNQTNSTTTVTIYCKMPNGFLMELGSDRNAPDYQSIGLKGINHMRIKGAQWGVTEGVSRDFWERWKLKMKGFKLLRNGHIFSADDAKDGAAMAKELTGLRTGLEPLKPKALPKGMKDVEKNVAPLTAD